VLKVPFSRHDGGEELPTPAASVESGITDSLGTGAARARRGPDWFASLRAREFARLDRSGEVYLDYTGSGLYAESQVRSHLEFLAESVLGNPHSESVASLRSTEIIEDARRMTLDFFAADPAEYDVVFTANASSALRLVGEAFPFRTGSRLVLSADNHNSVNGIREIARARGADVEYTRLNDELRLEGEERLLTPATAPSLFAFPAQSNFSGVQHPLGMIAPAQRAGYAVLLDAASYVPTNPLRLDVVHPEFVALSFYKMFGYPTGVGVLIARRDALAALERPSFAGGTVEFVSVQHRTHMLKAGAEGFEDGTPNFGALAALRSGLELLGEAGMDNVKRHVGRLTTLLLAELAALHHPNGRAMARVYGPWDSTARGGTVAFNVFDRYGRVVPYQTVEREALASGVSVRGGCFCNPGAAERAFGFPAAQSAACMERARHEGFSVEKFAECLGGGLAVGAVRASLGLASNEADVARLIDVVTRCG
jgi:selenocysteine lyase/cysteine desulfurase